jgi:glutathione S-transferase
LYGHWICPYATRVGFALAERGIAHDLVEVPPSAVRPEDFVLPTEFVQHSPRLEIPMVRVGYDFLADSIPVLEWLETQIGQKPLLPADAEARALVRERMAWLDRQVFRAMVGVYYSTDPDRIDGAALALSDALAEVNSWLAETPWLAGDRLTLAEAVLIPLYVRLDGLRRLGFGHPLPRLVDDHRRRCRELDGWSAIAWSEEQTEEFVGRFEAHRRRARAAV